MFQVFCINLRSRPDRRRHMTAVAISAGLSLSFVEAVDAEAPEHCGALAQMQVNGPVGRLGKGARACTLSHSRAWRQFLQGGRDYAVFLEDDVVLSRDFRPTIRALIDSRPSFDLIKIECGGSASRGLLLGRPLAEFNDRRLRACYQLATDSAGYVMSRRGAAAALRAVPRCDVGVDHFLFYPIPRRGGAGLPFAMIEPSLVVQDRTIPSDIVRARYDGSTLRRHLGRLPYEVAPAGHMLARMLRDGARVIRAPFRLEGEPALWEPVAPAA